ncbi:MAG: DUF2203 domain-containing protein [Bdellovibrionales bacterium]|nr:DUF2203 domain-containing protein [Bdellovibrionales bacterium]
MGEVIAIHQKRFFTLNDARQILPVIRRITRKAHDEVRCLGAQINAVEDASRKKDLEEAVYRVFKSWHQKITRLGCEAKGMWLVDFDSGQGFYCWRFPESGINHFHGYDEGYRGRVEIH